MLRVLRERGLSGSNLELRQMKKFGHQMTRLLEDEATERHVFVDETHARVTPELAQGMKRLKESNSDRCLWVVFDPNSFQDASSDLRKAFEALEDLTPLAKCFRNEHNIVAYIEKKEKGSMDVSRVHGRVSTVFHEDACFEAAIAEAVLIAGERLSGGALWMIADTNVSAVSDVANVLAKDSRVKSSYPGGVLIYTRRIVGSDQVAGLPRYKEGDAVSGGKHVICTDWETARGFETEAVVAVSTQVPLMTMTLYRATTTLVHVLPLFDLAEHCVKVQEAYFSYAGGFLRLTEEDREELCGLAVKLDIDERMDITCREEGNALSKYNETKSKVLKRHGLPAVE